MEVFKQIPEVFFNFIITLLISLLIGFEQRKRKDDEDEEQAVFGTDRTFAFIGALGFILFELDRSSKLLFTVGAALVALYFAVFYYLKIVQFKSYGMTSIIVGLITYTLGPVVITQPKWLTVLIVVSVLILVERKESFQKLSAKIDISEFYTLGKFLIIAGVVLPITPREPLIPYINISPYNLWLTVVIVSSISYVSYIVNRYALPKAGILLSGILGGLYSSTATTMVLSRQAKDSKHPSNEHASSIVAATSMMYIRVAILMFIFNFAIFNFLLPYIAILFVVSCIICVIIYFLRKPSEKGSALDRRYQNPLELKIALLFAALFVIFSMVTQYVIQNYGNYGLDILSYIIGFTDIDPFLLNLFQGNYQIDINSVSKAVLQAIASNNILKAGYTFIFADRKTGMLAGGGLVLFAILNIMIALTI